jgi:hypothetical protein
MRFHFHKWTRWVTVEVGRITSRFNPDSDGTPYKVQERTCEVCGKLQIRTVEAPHP